MRWCWWSPTLAIRRRWRVCARPASPMCWPITTPMSMPAWAWTTRAPSGSWCCAWLRQATAASAWSRASCRRPTAPSSAAAAMRWACRPQACRRCLSGRCPLPPPPCRCCSTTWPSRPRPRPLSAATICWRYAPSARHRWPGSPCLRTSAWSALTGLPWPAISRLRWPRFPNPTTTSARPACACCAMRFRSRKPWPRRKACACRMAGAAASPAGSETSNSGPRKPRPRPSLPHAPPPLRVRTMKLTALPFKLSFKPSFKRLALLAATTAVCGTALAQSAICYNCPPEWADWGTQIKAIKADTGITVPPDNKNSGQSLAQLVAEKASPVADVTYLGVTFAIQAQKDGVVAAYKPANWDQIPAGLKDPKGEWVTIHSGTLGFMVNKAALGGKPVPQSWADLLKPEYKGLVGYLDPASAFVGYVGAVAVNQAMGGTLDNFQPAIDYFKKLQKNEPIVPKQTSYARLLSGEIGILDRKSVV